MSTLTPLQEARREELRLGETMLELIRMLRKHEKIRGNTTRKISRNAGVSRSSLYNWERGAKITAGSQAKVFESLGYLQLRDKAIEIAEKLS